MLSYNIDGETPVCHDCIADDYLKGDVEGNGSINTCDFCGKENACIRLDDLADRIDHVLQENFVMSADGEQVTWVIADIVGWEDSDIAETIRSFLSSRYGYQAMKDGEPDPYGTDALYEATEADWWNYQEAWDSFREEVTKRSRFFSKWSQEYLGGIFDRLHEIATFGDSHIVREITPSCAERFIFRARVATSKGKLKKILESPSRELGPPPVKKAKAGRMNAWGISVFYGALEKDTCIAEARPPVGSAVVTGKFEIIRPVRLLDFDSITAAAYVKESFFHPEFQSRCGQVAFLRRVVHEMSKPVLPEDVEFDYLPTQAVAEFLAHIVEPRFDGLIFSSSQTGNDDPFSDESHAESAGHNVVLFNHACGVEPRDLPEGSNVTVELDWPVGDDPEANIHIDEKLPDEKLPDPGEETKEPDDPEPFLWLNDFSLEESNLLDEYPNGNPALRLDIRSVRVWGIKSVKYTTCDPWIDRYQSIEGKPESLTRIAP